MTLSYPSIDIAVKDGAAAPYIDVFIEKNDFYAGIAQDLLDLFELCDEACTIVMQGTPLHMFGIVDLTQYFADTGISSDLKVWRVVQEDISISGNGGVVSSYRLINPDVDLSDESLSSVVSTLTTEQMIQSKIVYQVESGKPVYAEVIA